MIEETLHLENIFVTFLIWKQLNFALLSFRSYVAKRKKTESKLKKLCPIVAHTLEITFNSLEDFTQNFENFKKSESSHDDLLIFTFEKNSIPHVEKTGMNGNSEIKRSFKKI